MAEANGVLQQQTAEAAPKVRWDTSNLKSSYANFCSATTTREEVVLNFGINHTWERTTDGVEVQLNDRIILSPFAARRLADVLAQLMKEYEVRYGALVRESQG